MAKDRRGHEYAYDNLPETQGQVGKVNKWAAAAYLAKIYMYQNKFAEAKALFDLIIAWDGLEKLPMARPMV